tara:strand:+ start:147 stop:743 length:597 start_codon:yes stop_codon:yes gene_type:complete
MSELSARARRTARMAREEAKERAIYDYQLKKAEQARESESGLKALLSTGGKAIGSLFGPAGIVVGDIIGKTLGDIGRSSEDVLIDMDVGKYGTSRRFDIARANEALKAADRSQFWKDLTDVGTTALTAWTLGGGSLDNPGNFSFTQYGGKSSGRGMGLFGKGEGGRSLWDEWGLFGKGSVGKGSGSTRLSWKPPEYRR